MSTEEISLSLYDRIGGAAAVDAAVDVFYDKVLNDYRINRFFEGIDMNAQAIKQKAFFTVAFGGPVRPPKRNEITPPSTKSIGVGVQILPFQRVATHEKNLTPVGTATSRVLYMNGTRRYSFIPDVNM